MVDNEFHLLTIISSHYLVRLANKRVAENLY